jgi:spore germination protein
MIIHVVEQGDTVYTIANTYNTTPLQIIEDNGLLSPSELVIGQSIVITEEGDLENTRQIMVFGYVYPNINRDLLLNTMSYITAINLFNYMVTEDGNLIYINDEELINMATDNQVASFLVLTNLEPGAAFNSDIISNIANNENIQDLLINNILDVLEAKNYYGVDIDFEYIYPEDKTNYENFLRKMTNSLRTAGYMVTTALAPKIRSDQQGLLYESHDYKIIGDIVDLVLLMTYEWGYTLGPPMAVAPLNSVERVLQYAVTEISPNKILMGIPNYGYDWPLPYVSGTTRAKVVSNVGAIEIALQHGATIQFDEAAQAPFFNYYDDNGIEHVVWFEDARSIVAKLALVEKYDLAGVFYWTLMMPFPQNWTVLENTYNIEKFDLTT